MASTSQDAGDIDPVRRVIGALDAADRALDRLQAFESSDTDRVPVRKVVAEAALLVYCAHRAADLDATLGQRVSDLARRLAPFARDAEVVAGLCMEPALALDHATAHLLLCRAGEPDARIERLLEAALQAGQFAERMPHRVLEQAWLARMHTPGNTSKRIVAMSTESALDHPIDVLASSRLDAYAFTHAAMYATDFGRDDIVLPRPRAVIAADLSALLAFALEADDFDLAGELALCWPMLRLPYNAAFALSLEVFRDLEDHQGFVHGRRFDPAQHAGLTLDARDDYAIATSYHTRFVIGMLHATLLATPRPRANDHAARRSRRGAANALFDRLPARHPDPAWRRLCRSRSPEARDDLAPFLLAAVLRDAHATANMGLLRDALALGLECGLVDDPAPAQAAALLNRCALLRSV